VETTTIVHFSVPPENVEEFRAYWGRTAEVMQDQPGLIDGTLRRSVDPAAPFTFINVARWESAEHLEAALLRTRQVMLAEGRAINEVFGRLGVKVQQHNYVDDLRYGAQPGV
jgi:heme-degrading monooxygenase HmoA